METRRFGRTGHLSTVAIFGAAILGKISQAEADKVMEQVIAAEINHIDIAPSYGQAEERLSPWMKTERGRFFLGNKTLERDRDDAWAELNRSLERLGLDSFDLFQIHGVTNMEELDATTRSGGSLETMVRAREEGLTRWIGITGHGVESPAVFREALRRFDFDTVLFPINAGQYSLPHFRREAEALLAECQQRDVGVMIIKAVARGRWGDPPQDGTTWYRAYRDPDQIRQHVHFALSQPGVAGVCTTTERNSFAEMLRACEGFQPMPAAQQEDLIQAASTEEPLFTR